ncbi:MAG: hypothetical protein IKS54_02130 [Erysipelotrichaceae bacterium]|nr:hypothetical protein [Erysipelotrichaceae bacterium]
MKNKVDFKALLITIVGFIAVWNVLDFLWCTLITKVPYHFSMSQDMLTPLLLVILIQGVQMVTKK